MAQGRFSWFDVTITLVSLLTLLLDVLTDIAVAVQLYVGVSIVWGSLILVFVVVPHVVIAVFSLKWHSTDGSLKWSIVLPQVCLLAPFQRYLHVLWLGFKTCKTGHPRYTDTALRGQNDASTLRLIETFLESAPQLLLQLLIMLLYPADIGWLQVFSVVSSLVSLAWALTAHCDASRLNYQTAYPRRALAVCLHFLWQLFMVTARVTALVLFASIFHAWICLAVGIHWLFMTVWIWIKGTDFGHGKVEKALFRIVSGFIYVFVFQNVHEGPSRHRMIPYYSLTFVENGAVFVVWIIYGKPSTDMKIGAAIFIFGGFLLGAVSLMVYYRWLHPSGPHYLFSIKTLLPTSLHRRPLPSRESMRNPAEESLTHPASVLNGSTLELSIEAESPRTESAKKGQASTGDSNLSHQMDPALRDALESAWQSGMHASDSSSTSSLDAADCSLDEFNSTAKSGSSILKDRSQSVQSAPQSHLSFVTVKSRHSNIAIQSQSIPNPSASSPLLPGDQLPDDCSETQGPSSASSQSKAVPDLELIPEPEEPAVAEESVHSEDNGGRVAAGLQQQYGKSRSNLSGSSLTPTDVDVAPSKPLLQRHPSSTPSIKPQGQFSKICLRKELLTDRFGKNQSRNNSGLLSPDVSHIQPEDHILTTSSSASDILPSKKAAGVDRLSKSFDVGESPIVSSDSAEQSPGAVAMSREASFLKKDREAMAPYPDVVESMSPEPQQSKMYLCSADMYGERAGGESMWGISPNTSNNSSSQSGNRGVSLPTSTSRLPRLVDSFDSESEPAGLNATDLQDLNKSEDCSKNSSACQSSTVQSPATNDNETSWSSMIVNENEWSGLNNLNALTPDESFCSFGSSDKESPKTPEEEVEEVKHPPVFDAGDGAISRSSTPSLARSKSTSSLYHEFSSAGVSPSPPPGLRAASRLSRNHSWVNSPFGSQPWQQPADTPWRLDHLNVDPAPPVEQNVYPGRCDPREVVIQMLMDQLKRTSFRSSYCHSESGHLSHLNISHVHSPPVCGQRMNATDQMLRNLSAQDANASLVSNPEQGMQGRRPYANDIDLMRKALDLIEMQRFPHRFGQGSPDIDSPEMYVSGQYRPPIVAEGRETPQHHSSLRTQAGHHSHSRSQLNTSLRQASPHSASLPQQSSISMSPHSTSSHHPDVHNSRTHHLDVSHSSTRHPDVSHASTHHSDVHHSSSRLPDPHSRGHHPDVAQRQGMKESLKCSMPAGPREGIYRYFVNSDSPIHTPLWNTPLNTPAGTPSQRHLLHRYLTQNHVEVGLREERVQSAETRSIRKLSSNTGGREQLSSTLPHRPSTFADKTSDTLPHNVTAHTGRTSDTHSQIVQAGRSDVRRQFEKLEVLTDHPDSGMHSGTLSGASRRQPLQSLDNSPSLSPSSLSQQPTHTKTTSQASSVKRLDTQRHFHGDAGQSSMASTRPESLNHSSSRSRSQGHGHRQAADRSADRERRRASSARSSEGSSTGKAKSVDRLR